MMYGPNEREYWTMAVGCAVVCAMIGSGLTLAAVAVWPLVRRVLLWLIM